MMNQRLLLAAGFGLVTITTLWFGFSATSLSQSNIVNAGAKCPPAITVAASTCQTTYTATLFETSIFTTTATAQALASAPAAVADKNNPIDILDDDEVQAKPQSETASHTTTAARPHLTPQNDDDFNLTEALTKYTCYPASADEAKKIALDTVPSISFNVVRGDNLVLGRKSKLPGKTFKTWYSVSRKPSSGCWTYNDRFGKYMSSVLRFLRTLGSVNECNEGWKRALVVHMQKGQTWNNHFTHHLSSIIAEGGWVAGYHVYLLVFVDGDKATQEAYVKDVIPEAFRPLAITFNNDELKAYLGKDVPFDKWETNNHVATQKFMHDYPAYEFVYFMNSHTRLMGRWDTLLKSVDEEYAFHKELSGDSQKLGKFPDLVTFDVTREPDEKWDALEWTCLQFFQAGEKQTGKVRRSLSAFGGFSRRMVDALAEVNKKMINCNSEYFPPTVAAHKDLTTFFYQHPLYTTEASASSNSTSAKVAENDAITVQQEKVAFDLSYSSDTKDAQSFWEEWVENEEVCRPEALLHPITGQF
ncbi:hypothetical protein ABW20_dc0108822 [Dactylellina cionopaga]|nr:hypothetical protein ABW20_dc0108822 [Dactylellina cionopaga]